ncbi:caspase domain-containing protein [Armillaria mellea]|nr:caspase domain-containing protein [Armillaria mellea]
MTGDADLADILRKLRCCDPYDGHEADLTALTELQGLHHDRAYILDIMVDSKEHSIELEMRPLPPGPSHPVVVEGSRFWVVIIGIDDYSSYPLYGCVSDARLMEKFFTEALGVPNDRIQLLLGSKKNVDDVMKPSRANIVRTLLGLATNDDIKFGDNIVVYFAGHGYCYRPSGNDDPYGCVETLCPIDRDTLDANKKHVPDISDREFSSIISLIAKAKGHRITVILDCCHAGGASRTLREPGVRAHAKMATATLQDMLIAGDSNLKKYRGYHSILAKDWNPDADSHVLLAACKDHQFAKEKKLKLEDGTVKGYIGIFTEALLHILQSGYCKEETTYANIFDVVGKSSHQTPVVIGEHKSARLWFQDCQALYQNV